MFDWQSCEGEQVLDVLLEFVIKCRDAPNFQEEYTRWEKTQQKGEMKNA